MDLRIIEIWLKMEKDQMKSKNAELIIAMALSLFMGLCLVGSSVDYYFTHKPPFMVGSKGPDSITIGAQDGHLQLMNNVSFWAGIIFWIVAFLIWSYRRKKTSC